MTTNELTSFLLPFLDHAREQPWFSSMMVAVIATLVIMMMFAIVARLLSEALTKLKEAMSALGELFDLFSSLKPKKKSLKELALAEEEANKELDLLSEGYGADRACIMLFHNGKTSLGNVHLLSASIKAEGGSGRFPKISNRIQSMPLSMYGRWTKQIITGHGVELLDCQTQAPDDAPEAYLMLEQHSVKSLYVYPVVTPSGDIDGCIFIEYCQAKRELGETEKAAIKARGQAIYSKLHEANNV